MAIRNRAVQLLVESGADAMDNLYDLAIKFPWEDGRTVMVRAKGFEPPEEKTGTYENQYHGEKLTMISTEATYTRTFSVTFRLDASYNYWGKFKLWYAVAKDVVSGGSSNWPGALGSVDVSALTGAYVATGDYKDKPYMEAENRVDFNFDYVYVIGVENPKFNTDGGKAMEYKVDFAFFDAKHLPFENGQALIKA